METIREKCAVSQLRLRIPIEIKDRVKESAILNRRSLNSEIIVCIKKAFGMS